MWVPRCQGLPLALGTLSEYEDLRYIFDTKSQIRIFAITSPPFSRHFTVTPCLQRRAHAQSRNDSCPRRSIPTPEKLVHPRRPPLPPRARPPRLGRPRTP